MQNDRRQFVPVLIATVMILVMAFGLPVSASAALSVPAPRNMEMSRLGSIERIINHLETAGFKEPTYLGITLEKDGGYPIFRVVTMNDEPANLVVRPTPYGEWEFRLNGTGTTVASASELAYKAQVAVLEREDTLLARYLLDTLASIPNKV